jgi:hypothetical protein
MNYSAPCKCCGQVQTFEGEEGMSQHEQMKKAMMLCDCSAAQALRRMEASRCKAQDNADDLLKDHEELRDVIKYAVDKMSESGLVSLTADSGTGYKATVKLTQKGTIKLTVKKEARWEIES